MFKQEMVITHAMNRNWPLGIPFLITDHRSQYGWQQPRSQGILSFWYRTAAKMTHPISERQDALGTKLWLQNLKDIRNFLFDQKNGKMLTLFKTGFFGWMGGGSPTSLKSVTHILQWWNLAQYMNHVTYSLSSADISIFSLEISKFWYIKKYRYWLHFDT